MPKLPALTARKVVAGTQASWVRGRSAARKSPDLINSATGVRIVVPVHRGRTIKDSLLRAIIGDAALTVDEFFALL